MKKRFILTTVLFFFLFIPKANAWVGDYTYDINSASVSGHQMVIKGWGIVKNSSGVETSMASPTYELWAYYYTDSDARNLIGDPQKLSVSAGINGDISTYLTTAYRDNPKKVPNVAAGNTCTDPGTQSGTDCVYTGIEFFLNFDLNSITDKITEINKDTVYVVLKLKINTSYSNAAPGGFNIAILNDRIDSASKDAIRNAKEGNITQFVLNTASSVEVIATNAAAQATSVLGESHFSTTYPYGEYTGSDSDKYARLFTHGVYSVTGVAAYPNASSAKYWSYQVSKSDCKPAGTIIGSTKCDARLGINACCFTPGSGSTVYIPAFWSKPVGATAVFTIKSEKEKLPKPPGVKTGSINPDSSNTAYDCNNDSSATLSLAPIKSFDNGYCSVTCSETVGFNINPYQTIKAGTSIQYPLAFNGTRTCSFGYAPGAFDSIMKTLDLATEYFKGITDGKYENDENAALWINLYYSLIGILNQCNSQYDQYTSSTYKYNINPTIDSSKLGTYTRSSAGNLTNSLSSINDTSGSAYSGYKVCQNADCSVTQPFGNSFPTVTNGWVLTSTLTNVTYRFTNHYWVEKRTGDVVQTQIANHLYYDGGYSYFTKMSDSVGKYTFTVIINGFARNMAASQSPSTKGHNANVTCGYYIEKGLKSCNPSTDPTCCTNGENCPQTTEPPGINVIYRQVSLKDLFPTSGKTYGANWRTAQALTLINKIQTLGNDLYQKTPLYTFKVSPTQNLKVKLYNATHKYGEFNLDSNGLSTYISTSGYYTRR